MLRTSPRAVSAFVLISLDGFYCDACGDMSFAHKAPTDMEWNDFVSGNAGGDAVLMFGRLTYEMMAAWWPSPMAAQAMPDVAAGMNAASKVVFSRTMTAATWQNTTLVKGELVDAVRKMKEEPGPDIVVLGSGSIVTQLAEHGLLDSLQVVVNPVALGGGKSLFGGATAPVRLRLEKTRVFGNGAIVCWYTPNR
jgi:dihydrofolate reductase